jgi:hypothetical protein
LQEAAVVVVAPRLRNRKVGHICMRMIVSCFALLALVALGLAVSTPAKAASVHVPDGTFNMQTLDGGPGAIAVDEQSDSVYVMDAGCCSTTGSIEKFDATGNPSDFSALGSDVIHPECEFSCFGMTVDNSTGPNRGTIYVSTNNNSGSVEAFSPSGQRIATFKTSSLTEFDVRPCGVAVGEDGNLIVAHGEGSLEFSFFDELKVPDWAIEPNAQPTVEGTIGSDFGSPCRTTEDSAGHIYSLPGTSYFETGSIHRFEPGPFGEPDPGGGRIPESLRRASVVVNNGGANTDIAVDGEGDVYAPQSSTPTLIHKYDDAGSLIESFGVGELKRPSGLAINKSTGTVYVGDMSEEAGVQEVHIFKSLPVPNSLTGGFDATGQTSGTLAGEVDPTGAGEASSCQFEYVPVADFEQTEFEGATSAPCAQPTPFASAEPVSAAVSGLIDEEPYAFRLQTENTNGASNGTVHTFTAHAVIGLSTKAATDLAPRSAKFNASFTGNGDGTEFFFEYGPSRIYGSQTSTASAGSPTGPTDISSPVGSLEPEKTYHYRVVAVNSTNTSAGEDQAFTTPPAVAGVTTKAASPISQSLVTLHGEFNGGGEDTHYYFEYGPTKSYGLFSDAPPGRDAGSTNGPTSVASNISTFEGYTTYHYRLVAANGLGTTFGPDLTFETLGAPLPVISGTAASNVSATAARLSAEIDPNRWTTTYLFEWGPTTSYGSSTELGSVIPGLGNEAHPVSTEISGLTPGTVYHYRAVAINLTGTTDGPDMTFATPGQPTVISGSVSAVGASSAHLAGLVSANASAGSVHFEYGTSTSYGGATAPTAIGANVFAQEAGADLAGLTPGTTYHVRVVAENEIGATSGSDLTFTTLTAPAAQPGKCAKGKVRRKGKCVKKATKKKHGKHGKNRKHGKHGKGKRNG